MIGLADIEAARERLADKIRRTPTVALDQLQAPLNLEAKVSLKLECLQVTGSFKARGAMNRLLMTPPDEIRGGIVTASGGNHGLAVARTAHVVGVPATIFVPESISPPKVDKIKAWNARVEIVGKEWSVSNRAALDFAHSEGASYFHPFADPLVAAGQGTLALDVLEDTPDIDAIVIAIGGGGLITGMSTALRALRPGIRIIGVEPTGAPTLKTCIDAGKLVELPEITSTVATMAAKYTEQWVYETVRDNVDEIVLVEDEDLMEASRWLWFEMGIAADLSGAAAIAALRRHPGAVAGARHVSALVCGAGAEGT